LSRAAKYLSVTAVPEEFDDRSGIGLNKQQMRINMKNSNLDSIIEKAIANEQEANQFYLKLSELVTDKAAKDTLLYMAQEEKKHKEYLLQYRQESFMGNAANASKLKSSKIAECLESPKVNHNMDSKDVYLLAAERELNSYNFYKGLASLHPKGEIKEMLLKMAAEELKHKEKAEYLYANTAFVQTAGG
jgi:rubrerythrin